MVNFIDAKLKKKDCLDLLFKGFLMGIANAIPGVSGGTIAFMTGIYEDLLVSIKSFNIKFLKYVFSFQMSKAIESIPLKFLCFLFLGVIGAILTLSKVLTWLIYNHPVFIYSFFFGLIVATVPIIAKVLKKWTLSAILIIFISAYLTFLLVNMVPIQTPNSLWFIFFSGIIAITSMILPGISGSFMLLLLGKYLYIMEAVIHHDFIILFIFALGAIVGILLFVRVLSWLFEKYHDRTISVLTGFVVGSLSKIWPWKRALEIVETVKGKIIPIKEVNILPNLNDFSTSVAICLIVLGFSIAIILDKSSKSSFVCSEKI